MFYAVLVVTDGGCEEGPEAGIPILATASSADGHLKLWRLDPRPDKEVRHPPPPRWYSELSQSGFRSFPLIIYREKSVFSKVLGYHISSWEVRSS